MSSLSKFVRKGNRLQLVIYRGKFRGRPNFFLIEEQRLQHNSPVNTTDVLHWYKVVWKSPVKVTASIPGTCVNLLLIERYKQLIQDTYTEPQNEEILGYYLNIQEDEGQKQNHEEISWKKREKITKKKEVKTKDIRQFFAPVVSPRNEDETRRTEEEQVLEIVEID